MEAFVRNVTVTGSSRFLLIRSRWRRLAANCLTVAVGFQKNLN